MRRRFFASFFKPSASVYVFVIISILNFFSPCLAGPLLIASLDKGKVFDPPRRVSSVPLSRGKFLVARGSMGDPRFHKTVIYLITYNAFGALGVVVNGQSRVTLAEALPHLEWLKDSVVQLSYGGPVEKLRLTILALSKTPISGAESVSEDLYAGWDVSIFKDFLTSGAVDIKAVRAFAGYAGWAPGQLDGEVARGGWRVISASPADIFRDTSDLWFRLMGRP